MIFVSAIFILMGFLLLVKSADFLVDGAVDIAKKFHINEMIIGLTIISLGTTMPELIVSTTSSLNGYADMAVGNAIGSIISNLLLVLGLTTVLQTIDLRKDLAKFEIPFSIAVLLLFYIMGNSNNAITRYEGIVLLLVLIGFTIFTIIRAIKEIREIEEQSKELPTNISIWKAILYIVLGIVGLRIGGKLTVDYAVIVAQYFNLSEKLIGVTVLAIGTSLPELCTCVSAAIKKKSDIAIGNILGANLLNILLIIGISSVILPLQYNLSYNNEVFFIIIANIILELFVFLPPKDKMTTQNGMIFLILYVGYIISLLMKSL